MLCYRVRSANQRKEIVISPRSLYKEVKRSFGKNAIFYQSNLAICKPLEHALRSVCKSIPPVDKNLLESSNRSPNASPPY